MFFFKSSLEEAGIMKNIFCVYEIALGQKINFNKPSIVFSPNVAIDKRHDIASCLGVSVVDGHGLYLGRLCQSKDKSGLNFGNLKEFNKAMLTKQAWSIVNNTNILVSRVFKCRYFPNSSFVDAQPKANTSFCWKGLFSVRNVLRHGLAWRIGDGSKVNMWRDKWLCQWIFQRFVRLPFRVLKRLLSRI